jgi:hypothetical protein
MSKSILSAVILAAAVFQSSTSHALVRLVTSCQTSDGKYVVNVLDNQGIGFDRSSQLEAVIATASGANVAFYAVHIPQGLRSASFGQTHYLDSATEGKTFDLAMGSTNFRNITLKAVLPDGTPVTDSNLLCRSLN